MKKNIITAALLFSALTAFAVEAVTIKIAADGTYERNGKKIFLIGPFMNNFLAYPQLREYKNNPCPEKLNYIYNEIPNAENLRKIGFNTICTMPDDTMYRVLSPNYKGFAAENAFEGYKKFIDSDTDPNYAKQNRWRVHFPNNENYYIDIYRKAREFFRSIRMPIYIETSAASFIFNQPSVYAKFFSDGKAAFNTDLSGTVLKVGFNLYTKSGRDFYLKLWKHVAEDFTSAGADVLCYELFNEVKYVDYSPSAREAFAKWLERRHGNLETLNRRWHTSKKSFEEAAAFKTTWSPLGLHVDWKLFMRDTLIDYIKEGRAVIRSVDPNAKTCVQMNGRDMTRNGICNMEFYRISEAMDVVNSNTGGSEYAIDTGKPETSPIAENTNVPLQVSGSILASRMALSLAQGKPIINNECYAGTNYESCFGRLWTEFARGRNATYLFNWSNGRHWKKGISLQETAMTAPWNMRNPYAFDPAGMYAIADAEREISRVADLFIPRANHPAAEIAILFSNPSTRLENRGGDSNISEEIYTPAIALEYAHYPYDILFEEQLAERAGKYKIILAHGIRNLYPESTPLLKKFVENGGTLVAALGKMDLDEYCNPLPQPLLDFKTKKTERKIRQTEFGKSIPFCETVPGGAWKRRNSAMLERKLGKGTIIYFSDFTSQYGLMPWYEPLFRSCGIRPLANLLKINRDERTGNVEMRKASADGITGFYLMNADPFPKLVRLNSPELSGNTAVEIFDAKEQLPRENGMVIALLPPRRRTVILVGKKEKFASFKQATREELQKRFDELSKKISKKNISGIPVNLRKFANKGFDNQQNFPVGIAWFEGNEPALRGIPIDPMHLDGVFCDLIRFDFNDNKTTMAFRSARLPDGLTESRNIPARGFLRSISFFHAVTHAKPGEQVLTYRIHYADNSHEDIPVVVGKNIDSWKLGNASETMKKHIAWQNLANLGFYRWEWINPHPAKEVVSLDILRVNGESDCTPLVVGITLHEADETETLARMEIPANWKSSIPKNADGSFVIPPAHSLSIASPDRTPLPLSAEQLSEAYICFEYNVGKDKWGSVPSIQTFLAEGYYMKNGKKTDCRGRENFRSFFAKNFPFDQEPESFQKAAIPLKLFLTDDEIRGLVEFQFRRSAENGDIILRDLHIRYKKGNP